MTIDFDKCGGLVPAIIQDASTGKVLMLGYMNAESYARTQVTGRVCFWSRSRQCLWTKGETSGNYLEVVSVKVDCDNDTLLIQATPHGPVCHTGTDTCWGEKNEANTLMFLTELQDTLQEFSLQGLYDMLVGRNEARPEGSYTTSLFRDGVNRMAQKVGEEALEACIEACNGTNERLVYEASDMLYHLIVLLTSKGLRIEQVVDELASRHKPGWKKH